MTSGATPLERRYRSLLRVLPRGYRERWAEDMVDTFLLANECDEEEDTRFWAEHGRPGYEEVASVLLLALRLRLGFTGGIPRYRAVGAGLRTLALLGLLLHTAVALVMTPLNLLGLYNSGFPMAWTVENVLGGSTTLLYLPVFLALVAGYRRAAGLLGAALAVVLLGHAAMEVAALGRFLPDVPVTLVLQLGPICAIGAFRASTPVVRPGRWLLALPVAAVLVAGELVLARVLRVPLDTSGALATLLAGCTVALLVARWRGALDPAPALALALFAGAALLRDVVGIVTMFDSLTQDIQGLSVSLAVTWCSQIAVLLVVTVLAGVLARRGFARLPDREHASVR